MTELEKDDWQEIAILIETKIDRLGTISSYRGVEIDKAREQIEAFDYFMDLKLRIKDIINGMK